MTLYKRLGMLMILGALAIAGAGTSTGDADAASYTTSAIIDNGTVMLGIWDTGNLNAPDGPASCEEEETIVGLRFVPTGCDSTSPGCTCEGWGVADEISGESGWANDADGGPFNLDVESFTSDADSAVSTVVVGEGEAPDIFRVTHDYRPSPATDNMYEVEVTIENLTDADQHVLYRRVMDWDVEPTAFDEMVTLDPGSASDLVFTSNNGFATADPLDGPSDDGFTGAFTDAGPADHGALFDFDFGTLAAGDTKTFVTFYGAAGSEDEAEAALAAVGAEAYSFGQTSTDPAGGTPNTFIFAFGSVGGAPIFDDEPDEPDATATPCIPPLIGYRCDTKSSGGAVASPTVAPSTPTAGTTEEPATTAVPATQAPSPGGGQAGVGVIAAPDTGDGSGTGGTGSAIPALIAMAIAGVAALAGGMTLARRRA